MSEWFCLRCDWTGGGDGAACPRCGVPLYRLGRPEPTKPRDVAAAARPRPWPAGQRMRSSPIAVPRDDESVPSPMPAAAAGRRWPVIVLAFIVAAGIAGGFIRRDMPEPSAALGGVEGEQEAPAVNETPASDGSPGTSTAALSTEPGVCPGEPSAPAELEPPAEADAPSGGTQESVNLPIALGPDLAVAAAVTADYRFQGSLESSVGTAPELVEVGHGSSGFADKAVLGHTRTVMRFAGGSGLSLAPTAGVIDSREYTIELLFRLHRLGGYRKIIDFRKASHDSGLYSLDGCLNFFDTALASRATIEVDSYVQVVLTRDASARVVGYVDGVRRFSFRDAGELAVIDANDTLLFFRDDSVTDIEYSGGAVSRIRLYDGPLTGNEVAGLACAELPGAKCRLTRAEYIAQADAICQAATDRFDAAVPELDGTELDGTELEVAAAWSEAAARFSEEALAELRALPPPKAHRARLNEFYSLLEKQTDVLRQVAAAASAGDTARVETLGLERIRLTHQKDSLEPGLQWCPVALPA